MSSRWQLTTQAVQRFHVIKLHTQHLYFSFQPTPEFGMGDTLQRFCWLGGATKEDDGNGVMPASLKLGWVHNH